MNSTYRKNPLFYIIVGIFIIYASVFIYRTSFLIGSERYFSLFDDAMVSMRYAKNLASGEGLVWNAGAEKVEGYTNPLWVFYMALLHLLPVTASKMSLLVQISAMVILVFNMYLLKKIAQIISLDSQRVMLASVMLTAFYYPFNNWTLQGLEVSLISLLLNLSLYIFLSNPSSKQALFKAYIILLLTLFMRIDCIVICLGFACFKFIFYKHIGKKYLIYFFLGLVASLSLQSFLRYLYYGDFLPNTYYLKMSGIPILLRLGRGMLVFLLFIWKLNILLVIVSFAAFRHKNKREIGLLFFLAFIQCCYSIYAGGDAWEWHGGSNRFISVIIPIFFVLFCIGITESLDFLSKKINERYNCQPAVLNSSVVYSVIIFSALLTFNAYNGQKSLEEFLLIKKPIHVEDNEANVKMSLYLSKMTKPGAKIAVTWAGAMPYFSDRYFVDLLSKNDKRIAKMKMRDINGIREFTPGHVKWDYAYSIGEIAPDVIANLGRKPDEAKKLLDEFYICSYFENRKFYIRKDSQNILKR